MPSQQSRISKLDGLRGILSVMVALNHSFLVLAVPTFANVWNQNFLEFHNWQSKINQIIAAIGNGGFAVTIFFVLSGFVMGISLSHLNLSINNYFLFLLKRTIRLMFPYVAMLIIVGVAMHLGLRYKFYPQASSWYLWWMNFDMTLKELSLNISMVHIYIGGVTWTLRVIFIISLYFPLLYLLSSKLNKVANLFLFALVIFVSYNYLSFPEFRDLRYTYMFFAGLLIPQWKNEFQNIKPSLFYTTAVCVSVLVGLFIRYQYGEYRGGLIETIPAIILIGSLAYSDKITLFNFLNHRIFQFLGKISYTLYLFHFTVLYFTAKLLFEFFPYINYSSNYLLLQLGLFLISLLISLPISKILYEFVEKPALLITSKVKSHD